ncbi:hypothetical protein CVU82_01795 [Candidatus Falkowbacteria bacterium HGW-Falkowbacteria-1]|uniref:Uncharacterized protein n=1 Tax=Candidatus Falkowbacteria bacterium HGW-Falkowbacteria-1 TaxID=2013768 RepID=A0A2N2E9G0_9BACT|nr:MAG: hypothetical protein CVU82_01795 [Candidatus Falkowbacteria bacterium HGW-Falkowbacteria-1]
MTKERFIILNQRVFADLMGIASIIDKSSHSEKIFQECRIRQNGTWEEGFSATVFSNNKRLLDGNIPTTPEDLLDDLVTGSFSDFFPTEKIFVNKDLFRSISQLLEIDKFGGFIIEAAEMDHKIQAKGREGKIMKIKFNMLRIFETLPSIKVRELEAVK